jgi:hypothetical protein
LLVTLMPIDLIQGQEDLCESFFMYNRAKGTLYDGETRLFLRGNGNLRKQIHIMHHHQ